MSHQWKVIRAADGQKLWLRLPDGHTQDKAPLVADDLEAVSPDAIEVHWGSELGMLQRHSLSVSHFFSHSTTKSKSPPSHAFLRAEKADTERFGEFSGEDHLG